MRRLSLLFLSLIVIPTNSWAGGELEAVQALEKDLKFDSLFPRRPYTGKAPGVQGWSHDDRYLAYLWNGYDDDGRDLWLFDRQSGKATRVTDIQKMATFDRDSLLAIEENKKTKERLDQWDKLGDTEYRETRLKFQKEQERRREPRSSYPGPSSIVWANKSNEFLMSFRGDIFRWKVGEDMPTRITQTRDAEMNVEYLPDDSGFTFQRGDGVYRVRWNSPAVVQLNPRMPAGINFDGYRISPDGTQMLVFGSRPGAPDRQVDYIVYRDRFAQARKTARGVADDDFQGGNMVYLFDITDKNLQNIKEEVKPYEIWSWSGGEELHQTSIHENPWSKDGRNFVFASWKRDQKELRILEASLDSKRVRTVYTGTSDGEHTTPTMTSPFYSGDGKHIFALLDKSGWRQIHKLERLRGEDVQLTKGDFETYPVRLAANGRDILAYSSKESLSRRNLYRVDSETGVMIALSDASTNYSGPAFANKSDDYAATASKWDLLRELEISTAGNRKLYTNSHRNQEFFSAVKRQPSMFSYKNRHGDTIQAYGFLPKDIDNGVKRPVFIYVYGGPLGESNSVTDGAFNSTAYMFNLYLTEVLGYITVTIDPRGQSGYSSRFGKANFDAPGKAQTEDLVDCVKFLQSKYPVDSTRVGLNGWSFGGFQTQHAMYNAPDVFTLGIAGAGPTQWQNYNTWYTGGVIGNSPKGDPSYLDKFSLTHQAKNLRNPLLLLHGMEDTNVLFQDTVMVYRSLLQAGKGHLVELSLDPTGGHGMGGDMDNRDRHQIYLAFLIRHWGLPQP